jgi:Domain of unknown function (DUF1983)
VDKPVTEQDLARETSVPSIPAGTGDKVVAALKQLVEVREGVRGSVLDANVTWRDLLANGLVTAKMVGGGTYNPGPGPIIGPPPAPVPGPNPNPPPGIPPTPTGLTATGAIFNLILEWDNPAPYMQDGFALYSNHAYTDVFRAPTNNVATAVRIGTSQTNFYVDSTGANASNYYWVRFVNTSNVVGPYSPGVLGETSQDPDAILDIIEGEILSSHLATSLSDRIDLIDAGSGVPGSVDARILSESEARVDGDDALALSISALAVSDDSGFDWVKIWYFDTTVESWGSNGGSPTVSSGWVKAYDHATNPYFTSPSSLGVATASYPLVKLYIKKTGSPVWEGACYFQRDGDSTWDAARSVTLSEPTWSGSNTATIVFDLSTDTDYTGTLKQIRIDLGADSDGTDYHEIDWVAIGRGAPSASTAQIAEIQSVRIGYCTLDGFTSTHGDRTACEAAGGTWNVGMPWATAVQQVGVTVSGNTFTIEERFDVQGTLEAQYTVKIDVNGYVSGFGLATEVVDGTPESAFIVRADKFAIIDPADTSGTATSTSATRSSAKPRSPAPRSACWLWTMLALPICTRPRSRPARLTPTESLPIRCTPR